MQWIEPNGRTHITRRGTFAMAAVSAVFATATARAALITSMDPGTAPVSNPLSPFDASITGNSYSLAPGTAFIPGSFDVRDLFGGSFGSGAEQNDIIFENNQPIGTVESVNVTLSSPISLTGFNLYLQDDGNGDRSASEFLLLCDGQVIDDVNILDHTGTQSYTSVYGSYSIDVSDVLSGLPASADYTLDFIQNDNAGSASGIRALDFQATGGGTPANVPEPASLAAMTLGAGALLRRRRQR